MYKAFPPPEEEDPKKKAAKKKDPKKPVEEEKKENPELKALGVEVNEYTANNKTIPNNILAKAIIIKIKELFV
jgi:hypothetical protein